MSPVETLWCHAGDHEFTRIRVRGTKPVACPDHKNARPPVEETLWCERGQHEWTRERATGSKPRSCRLHTANHHRRFRPTEPTTEVVDEERTPFAPLYGHLADAALALHTNRDVTGPLRRLAACAELLSLDPRMAPS